MKIFTDAVEVSTLIDADQKNYIRNKLLSVLEQNRSRKGNKSTPTIYLMSDIPKDTSFVLLPVPEIILKIYMLGDFYKSKYGVLCIEAIIVNGTDAGSGLTDYFQKIQNILDSFNLPIPKINKFTVNSLIVRAEAYFSSSNELESYLLVIAKGCNCRDYLFMRSLSDNEEIGENVIHKVDSPEHLSQLEKVLKSKGINYHCSDDKILYIEDSYTSSFDKSIIDNGFVLKSHNKILNISRCKNRIIFKLEIVNPYVYDVKEKFNSKKKKPYKTKTFLSNSNYYAKVQFLDCLYELYGEAAFMPYEVLLNQINDSMESNATKAIMIDLVREVVNSGSLSTTLESLIPEHGYKKVNIVIDTLLKKLHINPVSLPESLDMLVMPNPIMLLFGKYKGILASEKRVKIKRVK